MTGCIKVCGYSLTIWGLSSLVQVATAVVGMGQNVYEVRLLRSGANDSAIIREAERDPKKQMVRSCRHWMASIAFSLTVSLCRQFATNYARMQTHQEVDEEKFAEKEGLIARSAPEENCEEQPLAYASFRSEIFSRRTICEIVTFLILLISVFAGHRTSGEKRKGFGPNSRRPGLPIRRSQCL